MIIMLNGSFGVGKTTTALALQARLPHAVIFDAEDVGHFARHITKGLRAGAEDTDDFQDIRMWPPLVVATAQQLLASYGRPLIVPITLADPTRLAAIRDGFARLAPVYHFCLTASLPEIQRRLLARGDGPGSWPWRKASVCALQLCGPAYAEHVDAERQGVDVVAAQILARVDYACP